MLQLGMAKKRTRQEKVRAATKRQEPFVFKRPEQNKTDKKLETKIKTETTPHFYQPELTIPVSAIRTDLTKTLAVTILALILQLALAAYLSRGGWSTVNSLLMKYLS